MSDTRQENFLESLQAHEGIVRKVVYLYTDRKNDRDDLHQEIVYQAWKSYPRFKGDSKFSTWLYKVSINTAMVFRRHLDRNKGNRLVVESDQVSEPPNDARQQLLWAIRQLEKADRSLIVLHLDGYKNGEIAEILGLSSNHVGVKLHRIKTRIGKIIRKEEQPWT